MNNFKLDSRLVSDCHQLLETDDFILLLMNNALVPWFILVPKTDQVELIDVPDELRHRTMAYVHRLADFVRDNFEIDKLNIAAIGNVVKQLHIHVVGRREGDYCWPGVVWGASGKEPYDAGEVDRIRKSIHSIDDWR